MKIDDLVEGIDYFVYYVQFPNHANPSSVTPNDDGTFTIYLNTRFPPEFLEDRLKHGAVLSLGMGILIIVIAPAAVSLFIPAAGKTQEMAILGLRLFAAGMIPCFASEEALARFVNRLFKPEDMRL